MHERGRGDFNKTKALNEGVVFEVFMKTAHISFSRLWRSIFGCMFCSHIADEYLIPMVLSTGGANTN